MLVAATRTHVIIWYWVKSETTYAYTQLLNQLAPPLCVVLGGGQGTYSAIISCWPTTPHPTLPRSCPTCCPSLYH